MSLRGRVPWGSKRERRGADGGIQRRAVTRRAIPVPATKDYKRNIVRTLCACAAKFRNAAVMLET
jgi:hypothetical protein